MEMFIAVLGGSFFTFIIYCFVAVKVGKKKRMELIDWFLLSIAIFNGVGFAFIIWSTHAGKNKYIYSYAIMDMDISKDVMYLMLNIIFLTFVIIGWNIIKSRNNANSKNKIKLSKQYLEGFIIKRINMVAWIMLFIAIYSYWLYTWAYGGFIELLNFSDAIRSGVFEIENKFSFLQRFGGFSFFSSYIFYALLIDKEYKLINSKKVFVGFLISFLFSLYVLYSWVGRVSLVVYLATFVLGRILYFHNSISVIIRKLIFLFLTLIFLMLFVDVLLGRSKGDLGILGLYSKELSFPISNFYYIIDLSQYRWFKDIIVAPLYLLPSRIWSSLLNVETASSFMTVLISGARKGEYGVLGEIPVDIISFSFMQGSVIGIIIVGIIWGIILHVVQNIVNRIPIKSIRCVINANLIFNLGIITVLYGDPQHILVGNFSMISGIIMLYIFTKINFKNKRINY